MSDAELKSSELPDEARSLFDEIDDEAEKTALQRAEADIAAGRVIPHEDVSAWLKAWGTPEEGPAPAHWLK